MSDPANIESEQVNVSASKLEILISKQQTDKEKHARDIAKLKAELMAKEEAIKMYDETLQKMKLTHKTKSQNGAGSKRIQEELNKARQFDEWYEKNRDKMIEEEYNKNHKFEIDSLRDKLSKMI